MNQKFKLLTLLLSLLFVLNACTKKKTAGPKAESKPVVKDSDEGISGLKLPPPISNEGGDDADNSDQPVQRTPTPEPRLKPGFDGDGNIITVEGGLAPAPGGLSNPDAAKNEEKKIANLSHFQSCVDNKLNELLRLTKQNNPQGLKGPKILNLLFNNSYQACSALYSEREEGKSIILAKLGEAVPRHFPDATQLLAFYMNIETKVKNKTLTEEIRNQIYDAFGSGIELESNGVQFFGLLEGSKVSSNSISYSINRMTGLQKIKLFNDYIQTKSESIELANTPVTSLRLVFDFSSKKGHLYKMTLIDGDKQMETYFAFIPGKGDIEKLRAGELVTISFAMESWTSIVSHNMKKLITANMPQLDRFPISFTRSQANTELSRTCALNDSSIACTDPDYVGRANISPQGLAAQAVGK